MGLGLFYDSAPSFSILSFYHPVPGGLGLGIYIPRDRVNQFYIRVPQDCHILPILLESVRGEFLNIYYRVT